MKKLFQLFITFFKIGLFTFGGGYAMISIIEHTCVEKKKWITDDEMINMTVIAESTPGPIAINCATFVGLKQAGFWGGIFATLGVVTPSFIIIYIISLFLDNFLAINIIANAFKGIKAAVGLLILDAAIKMFKKAKKNIYSIIVLLFSLLIILLVNLFSVKFSSVTLILICAVTSLVIFVIKDSITKKEDKE